MKNYSAPGEVLELAAPSGGVVTGLAYKIGSLVVIATVTAAATVRCSFIVIGVVYVLKVTTETWTEGVKIYWDDTAKLFTSVSTSNTLVGVAVAATVNPSASGYVRLDGVAR